MKFEYTENVPAVTSRGVSYRKYPNYQSSSWSWTDDWTTAKFDMQALTSLLEMYEAGYTPNYMMVPEGIYPYSYNSGPNPNWIMPPPAFSYNAVAE